MQAAFLETGGVACGGGILSHALHAGLADAGLRAHTRVANEIRSDLVGHAIISSTQIAPCQVTYSCAAKH